MEDKGIVLPPPELLQRGELGGSLAAQPREYNPFVLHVAFQYGLQRVKAKVPFPQFFSTMAELTPTTSLYVVEVPETSDAVFIIHNIIRGTRSFWL